MSRIFLLSLLFVLGSFLGGGTNTAIAEEPVEYRETPLDSREGAGTAEDCGVCSKNFTNNQCRRDQNCKVEQNRVTRALVGKGDPKDVDTSKPTQ